MQKDGCSACIACWLESSGSSSSSCAQRTIVFLARLRRRRESRFCSRLVAPFGCTCAGIHTRMRRGFMLRLRQLRALSWPRRLRLGHLLTARRARWGVRGTRYVVGGTSALKSGRALISAGVIVAVLASCAAVEPTIAAEPGVAFSLPAGKTAGINGSRTRIRFDEVRNDSRCPADVTCVWAGDAQVVLTISRNGSPDVSRILGFIPPKN